MSAGASFVPLEEQRVDFYGDEIVAVLVRDPDAVQVYVPLRPIVSVHGYLMALTTQSHLP